MMKNQRFDVAIIGCGSVGLATAYYLARHHGITRIALIDCGQPMAFTSAQSGENYRNWWPHPSMVSFTNRSIDLLEALSLESGNRINMNRRGYALATRRRDIDQLVKELNQGLGESADRLLRFHSGAVAPHYQRPVRADWQGVHEGVDILQNKALIQAVFPSYSPDIESVVHIRRGGDISAQQLGMLMLESLKAQGARRIHGTVEAIQCGQSFILDIVTSTGSMPLIANKMVNAAGPFAGDVAEMMGLSLPILNTFQQKIAFDDVQNTIPRGMPFSIDLDEAQIDWDDDERLMMLDDETYRWLAETMPGGIHCRPDGGDAGRWIKLGWAYNQTAARASRDLPFDEHFPEVVLRGAARLNPALKNYYGRLPRAMHHYGGWYSMTEENWPLIGPMGVNGAFMNCAMSGFGTMSACASGELCAAWVAEAALPSYAKEFSRLRYDDTILMKQLQSNNKGIL